MKYCKYYDGEFIPNLKKYLYDPRFFNLLVECETTFTNLDQIDEKLKESNKREYLVSSVLEKMKGRNGFRRKNLVAFRRGFFSLMPEEFSLELRSLLNPFEKLVFGDSKMEFVDLMKNLEYYGGIGQIKSFLEKVLSESDDRFRWDFVRFCTGSCDVVNGLLLREGVVHKICVRKHGTDDYLMAHTCGYTLDVGKNFEEVKEDGIFERFRGRLVGAIETFKLQKMEE